MNAQRRPQRITWLVPDDAGGGVISVGQAFCRQAAKAGETATLLLALPPTGHAVEFGGIHLESLNSKPPHADAPGRLIDWLVGNPQDVLFLNGCEEADVAIPFVPVGTRLVYVVHDTAGRYFRAAVQHEALIDCIVAVSETVAARVRPRLQNPRMVRVVHNGSVFPDGVLPLPASERADDLVFLGGDKALKGAFDCLALWRALTRKGFKGRLHWFGEMDQSFQNRVAGAPERSRIVLYGRQRREAVFKTASQAKVVLMLSREEPFGMATIECMSMGCLPVAWDIRTGTKEIVGDAGWFAPLGDFGRLADHTVEAIAQHSGRVDAASRRIRAEFSEVAMWTRYQAVLSLLAQSGPVVRPAAGQRPPAYRRPVRVFQFLPSGLRSVVRTLSGRWPYLGFLLRNVRGR